MYVLLYVVRELHPIAEQQEAVLPQDDDDVLTIPGQAWAEAQRKLSILQPVLAARGDFAVVAEVCRNTKLGKSTIYRWLKAYEETGSVRSLVELPHTGGKNKTRLDDARVVVINDIIAAHYLTRQKKPVSEVVLEVKRQC